jgi:hypothetical protein
MTDAGQAIGLFDQIGSERMKAHEDSRGWAHRIHAAALLGSGHPADASVQAEKAMAILRAIFDWRPSVAAEALAKAALVQARCVRAINHPAQGTEIITANLSLLQPLIDRHGAKLGRVLRDMLDELKEISPESLQRSPALEIEASLGDDDGDNP